MAALEEDVPVQISTGTSREAYLFALFTKS